MSTQRISSQLSGKRQQSISDKLAARVERLEVGLDEVREEVGVVSNQVGTLEGRIESVERVQSSRRWFWDYVQLGAMAVLGVGGLYVAFSLVRWLDYVFPAD